MAAYDHQPFAGQLFIDLLANALPHAGGCRRRILLLQVVFIQEHAVLPQQVDVLLVDLIVGCLARFEVFSQPLILPLQPGQVSIDPLQVCLRLPPNGCQLFFEFG